MQPGSPSLLTLFPFAVLPGNLLVGVHKGESRQVGVDHPFADVAGVVPAAHLIHGLSGIGADSVIEMARAAPGIFEGAGAPGVDETEGHFGHQGEGAAGDRKVVRVFTRLGEHHTVNSGSL